MRALRMLPIFETAWKLARGLLGSMATVGSTLMIVVLLIYICACIGMEIMNHNKLLQGEEEVRRHVEKYFGSLSTAMMTLVQLLTLDGAAEVYLPVIEAS